MKKWVNHPCISQDRDNGKLRLKIFQFFYCEMNLPKYQKNFKFQNDGNLEGEEIMMERSDFESIQDALAHSASSNDRNNADYIENIRRTIKQKIPFLQKVYNWLHKTDPVSETFNKIKNNTGHIDGDLKKVVENIDKLIKRAAKANQIALVDKLKETRNVVAAEIVLSKHGYDKYVTEEKIIEFFKKCNRGVRIDFIRNYSTLIPFNVLEKKDALDNLGVFDNYVVMHYDPNMVVFKETEADKQAIARKDPILFGMIKGSRKLYFVDDWITDEDDLTLDELNIVVENATSRLAKFDVQMESTLLSLEDFHVVLQDIKPVEQNEGWGRMSDNYE